MTDDVKITRAITYRAATPVSSAKQLDIYHAPEQSDATPTLIYLHGGGWRAGAREHAEDIRQIPVARAGVNLLSISYTLTPEAPFPASIEDIYAAIDWVREHGAEHGLATDRIALSGASAGGHLVAVAALKALATGDTAHQVRGVVSWFPGTDLLGGYLKSKNLPRPPAESFEGRWANGPSGEWPPAAKLPLLLGAEDLSTVTLAQALELDPRYYLDLFEHHEAIPPFLILTGSADFGAGPNSGGPLLHHALKRVGADVQLIEVFEADHEDAAFGTPTLAGTVRAFVEHAIAETADANRAGELAAANR